MKREAISGIQEMLTSLEWWEWKLTSVVTFWIDVRAGLRWIFNVTKAKEILPPGGENTVPQGMWGWNTQTGEAGSSFSPLFFQRISLGFPCYMMCTWCLLKQFLGSNAQRWMSVLVSSDTYVLPLNLSKVIDLLCQLRCAISPCLWRSGEAEIRPSKKPLLPMKLEGFLRKR